jgi:hypothetical protein
LKKLVLILSLVSLFTLAEENKSEEQYSIGLGIGSAYTGLGANFSFISKTDMKYISAGCVEYSSVYGSTCGFGAGWIVTDLFDLGSNKHGFGVYASLVGNEQYGVPEGNGYSFHDNNYYGVGVSYTYFLNGIDKPGFNFGASFHATNAKDAGKLGSFLQVGYQF